MTTRTENFKILLTPKEAEELNNRAHDQRTSKADYARYMIFGPGSCERLPSATALRKIAFLLAGISNNLNQCQHSLNFAKQNGTLNPEQFAEMYKAIQVGYQAWNKPMAELRDQLTRFKRGRARIR